MHKSTIHRGGLLVLLALAALTLRAQDDKGKPPIYTYISEWTVPRAQWGDFLKNDAAEKPLMDKLVADSTLIGYGTFVNLIHQEGEPTHGSWMTATSEGRLVKALEAVWALPGLTSTALAASKHWDYMLESRMYNSRSGTWEGGYLSGSQWDVKAGEMRSYNELVKSTLVPVFEKLVTDGVVTTYGFATEDYHTGKIGRVTFYFMLPDADALDKVDKALDEAFDKNPEYGMAFRSLVEREGHRDFLDRVRTMTNK
ncbi:MAG: hypothetical protein ABSH47_27195 [Bryobacteraceae bacterium]|jgi:hypothetical protein